MLVRIANRRDPDQAVLEKGTGPEVIKKIDAQLN